MFKCNFNFTNLMRYKNSFINEILFKFNKSALFIAVEKGNIEIIKLLLSHKRLNINIINVLFSLFQIEF